VPATNATPSATPNPVSSVRAGRAGVVAVDVVDTDRLVSLLGGAHELGFEALREAGAGERLLTEIEARARRAKLKRLFVLTTRAEHWFVERGFDEVSMRELPREKRQLYNYQRRSVVLVKRI